MSSYNMMNIQNIHRVRARVLANRNKYNIATIHKLEAVYQRAHMTEFLSDEDAHLIEVLDGDNAECHSPLSMTSTPNSARQSMRALI